MCEIATVNLVLAQRWFFSIKEQREAWPYRLLERLKKEKANKLDASFSRKKLIVLSTIMGVFDAVDHKDFSNEYLQTEKHILEMAANKRLYKATHGFPLAILGLYQIGNKIDAFVYMSMAEEIVQVLNLDNEQKKECFYFLSESTKYIDSSINS